MTNERIAAVQDEVLIVTDVLRNLEAKRNLQRLEEERRDITAELETLPGIQLGEALLRLDYTSQVKRFRDVVSGKQTVAILVAPDAAVADAAADASRLLLKRLLRMLPNNRDAVPIRLGFEPALRRSTVDALWQALARALGLARNAPMVEVTQEVTARLQNQNVVVILKDLDRLDVAACLSEFWRVLAEAVTVSAPPRHLVLFLVDTSCSAPQVDEIAAARDHLLALQVVSFPSQVVADWFEFHLDHLPAPLMNREFVELARLVVDRNDGRPDDVLWNIYDLWDCPGWELDAWLKV